MEPRWMDVDGVLMTTGESVSPCAVALCGDYVAVLFQRDTVVRGRSSSTGRADDRIERGEAVVGFDVSGDGSVVIVPVDRVGSVWAARGVVVASSLLGVPLPGDEVDDLVDEIWHSVVSELEGLKRPLEEEFTWEHVAAWHGAVTDVAVREVKRAVVQLERQGRTEGFKRPKRRIRFYRALHMDRDR